MSLIALQRPAEHAAADGQGGDGYVGLLALADALVSTGFLPDHIKTGGQAAAIILAGRELGMPPMRALRSITMVKGKIVIAADAQLALFKAAGGRATFEVLDDTRAVLALMHPNGDSHTESFTIEDAKRAGLLNNANWRNFPKAMLRSRAITAGLKSVGFEPTSGAYDPDEAQHFTALPSPAPEALAGDAPSTISETPEGDARDYGVCPAGPHAGSAWSDLDVFTGAELRRLRDYFLYDAGRGGVEQDVCQGYAAAISREIARRLTAYASQDGRLSLDDMPERAPMDAIRDGGL